MMNFYEFVDSCREDGLSADDALYEWEKYQNEAAAANAERLAELEWSSLASSYQQDYIDMRRYER